MPGLPDNSNQFISLFLQAEPRVYSYIRTQIHNRADAEDILQDTAATLWSHFDDFERGTNFLAWAYKVARFKVQNHHKKQSRRSRLFSNKFLNAVARKSERMSDELGELQAFLAECMKRLPPADGEVVQLCYGTEATIQEVSVQLGRPVNTIKSMLKRARRTLYDCIERAMRREDRP